jgi:hypothetical protein
MRYVPFTLYVAVYPKGEKRFEIIRDLHKISKLVYDGLLTVTNVNIATPGGGQEQNYKGSNGGFSGYVNGCAAVPQFGESPAQLRITGFYGVTSSNQPTFVADSIISNGVEYEGFRQHKHDSVPTSTVNSEVKALRTALNNKINAVLPGTVDHKIIKIDYNGIVFGQKGYHFPE